MNFRILFPLFACLILSACKPALQPQPATDREAIVLSIEEAGRLAALPLACMQTEYPNKPGQTLGAADDLGEPGELHPAFYGCFDWHSAVHGHWSLVNLKPLTALITERYFEFLPKLIYPVRVGEHGNTAFGLCFAWDYANTSGDSSLLSLIESRARNFYMGDMDCPLDWEPGGFDFLSPCLEEIDLMRRVLDEDEFLVWIGGFAPQLLEAGFKVEPARVSDRRDGKLVHLDGLNFSRAWVLYGLARQFPSFSHLLAIADAHVNYSLPNLVEDSYEGGHWLGTFAIYAIQP